MVHRVVILEFLRVSKLSKVVRFYELGGAEVLKIEEMQKGEPQAQEVRIVVHALGLNRAEILLREGRYLETAVLPARIGYEASGVVEAVGTDVSAFKVGDRVSTVPSFSQSKYGVYGEWAIVPARSCVKIPDGIADVEAASIWMQYLTAYGALVELGSLQEGQWVLITAASSSVGFASLQIAKRQGARTIATTRSAAKKQALLDVGFDHVIATDEDDVVKEVMAITGGKGADLIFDAVAGPLLLSLARAASYEASVYIYGALSLQTTAFPLKLALKKGLSINGYTMFQVTDDDARFERGKAYVLSGLADGSLKPVIDRVFPFAEIVDAQRYMESNLQMGKIVVVVKE